MLLLIFVAIFSAIGLILSWATLFSGRSHKSRKTAKTAVKVVKKEPKS